MLESQNGRKSISLSLIINFVRDLSFKKKLETLCVKLTIEIKSSGLKFELIVLSRLKPL